MDLNGTDSSRDTTSITWMHGMDNLEVLKKVASLSRKAKSWSMSKGEQVSYLHQTLLAISNILDYEEDKLHRFKGTLTEEVSADETVESGYPSSILQLYTQRVALQANGPKGFQSVPLQSLSTRDNPPQTDDHSISLVVLEVISSLDLLCHNEWKHLFEHRQNSQVKLAPKFDPFSQDCSVVDEQCNQLLMQQLSAIEERCKKLAEEEKRAIAVVNASYTSREDEERQSGKKKDRDEGLVSFEECTWRIEERLAGYEECLDRLLDDLWDWKDELRIKVLEENKRLLIEARWVKKLMALALEFKGQMSGAATKDEIERRKRVLKLSYNCFAALPLPLQSTLFQWLWDQPNGPNLFKDTIVINVEQELTHVFNRLVTGSTDSQLTERAREICSIALHCPTSTLQKAILEAVSNADAGKLICKVLQCIPLLVQLQVDGATCFLTELSRYVRTLGVRELSSSEELNLFKFAENIMQDFHLPTLPGCPITCPPLVCPLHLADSCIWPFLGPVLQDRTLSPGPGPPSQLSSGSTPLRASVPKHIMLKLLDLVFRNSLSSTNGQERGVLDISVCCSTMISLCQLLQECTVLHNGDAMYNFLIKHMTFDLLERMSSYVQAVHTEVLSVCLEWLGEEISDLDWTVRLTLHALFSEVSLSCQKEVNSYIEEITVSVLDSQLVTEAVPLYVAWSSSLVAFFQGARISSQLSKRFVKSLSGTSFLLTPPSREDFYRAVCLALAQVLPHSTAHEWLTILGTLDLMKAEGLLPVTYTANFMTSLPACDITMCQHHLQLSQVFTTVIQLLSESSCSDLLKDAQWQHVTKTYTQVIKEILSNATESISSSPPSSAHASLVFLIGQLFCQSCEVSRCVSEPSTEQLFVWCLELVMRVEELVSCHSDDDAVGVIRDVAYQEMKTLSRAIEWLPSNRQRSTLQQKLSALSSRC